MFSPLLSGSPQKEGKLEYHFFHSSVGFGVTYFEISLRHVAWAFLV